MYEIKNLLLFSYDIPDMIPLAVRVILYGFDARVPIGGFPTKGYNYVMDELTKMKQPDTIFPENTYKEVFNHFYWSQKSRWAFKRLLLFWNDYRFKNQYGNEEDLYGNSFDDYEEPKLTLWDWRSRRYYRFGYTELIKHGYTKLNNYNNPTNPYINMPFHYCQCIRIHDFLKDHNILNTDQSKKSIVEKYTRFPNNMSLNVQNIMEKDGFTKLQDHIQSGPVSLAENILLNEIINSEVYLKNEKKTLSNEMKKTLFKLIVNEDDDISYVPDTKQEKQIFEIFVRYGLDKTIEYYNDWLHTNRKIFKVKRDRIRSPFYNIVINNE